MKRSHYKTYVGADLHKIFTQFNAQAPQGKELCSRRVENTPEAIGAFLAALPGPVQVAVEATANAAWFCDVVRAAGHDTLMAHPRETRAKSGTREKSDRFDAKMLATLLRGNLIEKQAWHAPEDVRRARERLRHMALETRTLVAHKNKAHSILIRLNIRSPYRNPFCKKGQAFLDELDLPAEYRTTLDRCRATIAQQEAFLAEDVAWCERQAKEIERVWLLTTMPGIAAQLATLIHYETGDVERFHSADAYVNYIGLVPGKEQSSGHIRNIGITKEGSGWLRWAFVEAAQSARYGRGRLGRFYWRQLIETKNHGRAITATAREMARIAYHIMKRGQGYYEPIPQKHNAA